MIRTLFNLSFHLSFLWKSPKKWDSWLRLQKTLERLMPWRLRHPCLKRKIFQNTRSLKRIQWNIPNTRSTTSNLSKSVPVKTWRQSNPDSSLCSVDKGKDNENTGGEGEQSCKNEKSKNKSKNKRKVQKTDCGEKAESENSVGLWNMNASSPNQLMIWTNFSSSFHFCNFVIKRAGRGEGSQKTEETKSNEEHGIEGDQRLEGKFRQSLRQFENNKNLW